MLAAGCWLLVAHYDDIDFIAKHMLRLKGGALTT
jgi:hypothetical protein